MDHEVTVSGHALLGESLEERPVTIVVKSGIITHIEDDPHPGDNWIIPAFFNAHTHLGDSVAMDTFTDGDLVSLVTPPDGLKHRLLALASRDDTISGMRSSIQAMVRSGTAGCADFREGGINGTRMLQEAGKSLIPELIILGREGGELVADGLGVSSVRDVPHLERVVSEARNNNKLIAFHAGEKDPDDIDSALSFNPDLLIHCTHATRVQLRRCADEGIPIAVCPRSNWALGVAGSTTEPPLHDMIDLGCRVFIGTDNVMFIQPDMFAEMAFAHYVYRVPPAMLIRAAIEGSLLGKNSFFIRKGVPARFFVMNPGTSNMRFSLDHLSTIVKRGSSASILKKIFILES
ncbi:MAG: amidohydrolase family protein [Methanoregulaceae archaeon]|jgi:cytosine/adenosine deaminase-related metal-dependent hydrolase|nr:amidohydrolase family protein [Methanoregulaceae archaeon]